MFKKYRSSGNILSAQQLKEIKGGTIEPQEQMLGCYLGSPTCPNPCTPDRMYGNDCLNGRCRRIVCN